MSSKPTSLSDNNPEITLEEAVLTGLCYADCFDFSPTLQELPVYIPFIRVAEKNLRQTLDELRRQKRVDCKGEYYFLPGREELAAHRHRKQDIITGKWAAVHKYMPALMNSSWIKAVLLTGSLAANNPGSGADADLFLILDHRRMWLVYLLIRTCFRRQKNIVFCPNYAVSDRSLDLLFPNLFTAVELTMALPLKYHRLLEELEDRNSWTRYLVPNGRSLKEKTVRINIPHHWTVKFLDLLIGSPLGWVLDRLEYHRLRIRTRRTYLPNSTVYKPHPPKRQYLIFKELGKRLQKYGIRAPMVTNHIEEQFAVLGDAIRKWDSQREPSAVKAKPGQDLAQTPRRKCNAG